MHEVKEVSIVRLFVRSFNEVVGCLLIAMVASTSLLASDELATDKQINNTVDDTVDDATIARPVNQSGMMVYIDRETGKIIAKPPSGSSLNSADENSSADLEMSIEELQSISTSHEGLYEVPLDNGGYMVNLQGRFRHTTVVSLDQLTGQPEHFCLGNQPLYDVAGNVISQGHFHGHSDDDAHDDESTEVQ